jgi:hypothetical protein
MKISIWSETKAKVEILKRFQNAVLDRSNHEATWRQNERSVFSSMGMKNSLSNNRAMDFALTEVLANVDQSNANVATSYTMKNLRFMHAQMASNPPAVAIRPQTSDQDDQRKADAADRIVKWALRKYNLQERQDQCNLSALLYGSGMIKTIWDSTKGDIIEANMETEELTLAGDISITVPFIWNMYFDPDARNWDDVKWIIERTFMDYDEAVSRWPDKIDELQEARIAEGQAGGVSHQTELRDTHYNSVELLEYWEVGLPTNGYLGRYCIVTRSGGIVDPCRPNPFRFRQSGSTWEIENSDLPDEVKKARINKLPEKAHLPYHLITDLDVPNTIWGKSTIEYVSGLQDNLNRLDSARLDNIQAHGVARMILPESAEISDDALGNSPWDVIKITGNQPPYFMSPPQLMPELSSERNNYITGINDVMGVNEAMFGQQSREQSGASMQYATNQGNMIRHRLFNKYVGCIESVYKAILNLVCKHWSTGRTIHVLGKEQALEALDVQGMDIDGGYDVVGEYGTTLSLDPITRQQQIITLQPLFEKAGMDTRTLIKKLRLNDMDGMFDAFELAGHRQKEIFDEMTATGSYLAPEEQMDHQNMIAWSLQYFMTQEFTALAPEVKALLKHHNKDRAAVAAKEGSSGAAPEAGPPGAPPPPPAPPGAVPPPPVTPPPTGAPQ